ncbi:hypothetical protein TKK_0009189 [Trichogramma kaykai]
MTVKRKNESPPISLENIKIKAAKVQDTSKNNVSMLNKNKFVPNILNTNRNQLIRNNTSVSKNATNKIISTKTTLSKDQLKDKKVAISKKNGSSIKDKTKPPSLPESSSNGQIQIPNDTEISGTPQGFSQSTNPNGKEDNNITVDTQANNDEILNYTSDEEDANPKRERSPQNYRNRNLSQTDCCNDFELAESDSKFKLPPIYVKNCEAQALLSKFTEHKLQILFNIKNTASDSCMLKTNNNQAFNLTILALKELDIEFITFTRKEIKPKSILLKGLHAYTSCEDVKHNLSNAITEDVEIIKISEFKGKPRSGKTFLIQLTAESNIKAITKLRYMNHQVISWETLNKPEPPQCRRCQRIAHVASNCNMHYRCVKCTDDHKPGECQVGINGKEVQCVLCGNKGHPASYKGCVARQTEIEKIKSKYNSTKRSNFSYAEATKNNQTRIYTASNNNLLQTSNKSSVNQQQQSITISNSQVLQLEDPSTGNNNSNYNNIPHQLTSNNRQSPGIGNNHISSNELRLNNIEQKLESIWPNLENILIKIKNDICHAVQNEFTQLQQKTQENTQKIDHIMNLLNLKWTPQ